MNYKKCTILTETETRTRGNTVSRPDPATVLREVREKMYIQPTVYKCIEIIDAKLKELEG